MEALAPPAEPHRIHPDASAMIDWDLIDEDLWMKHASRDNRKRRKRMRPGQNSIELNRQAFQGMTEQNRLAEIEADRQMRLDCDPAGILNDAEWDFLKKSGVIKPRPRKPKEDNTPPNFITDEEFLAILFCDPDYKERLHAVAPDQGFIIGKIIEEARENLAEFLALPDARELFQLQPKKP